MAKVYGFSLSEVDGNIFGYLAHKNGDKGYEITEQVTDRNTILKISDTVNKYSEAEYATYFKELKKKVEETYPWVTIVGTYATYFDISPEAVVVSGAKGSKGMDGIDGRDGEKGEKGDTGAAGKGRNIIAYTSTDAINIVPPTPQGGHYNTENGQMTWPSDPISGYTWGDSNELDGFVWLSNCDFDNDGEAVKRKTKLGVEYTWSAPFCITGEDGDNGTDGNGVEFIYYRPNGNIVPDCPTISPQIDDYLPEVTVGGQSLTPKEYWTDHPNGINIEHKIEYVCTRRKTRNESTQEILWSAWTGPTYWARWGEDGNDGDGVEYIYATASTQQVSYLTDRLPRSYDKNFGGTDLWQSPEIFDIIRASGWTEDYTPWTDDPSDVSAEKPFEYVAIRKKKWDDDLKKGVWDEFGTPTLWSHWGKDGERGNDGTSIQLKAKFDSLGKLLKRYHDDRTKTEEETDFVWPPENGEAFSINTRLWVFVQLDKSTIENPFDINHEYDWTKDDEYFSKFTQKIDNKLYWFGDFGEFKGESGLSSYVHIKYAKQWEGETGDHQKCTIGGVEYEICFTSNSGETPGEFIATYSDNIVDDASTLAFYCGDNEWGKNFWTKWKGDDGQSYGQEQIFKRTQTNIAPNGGTVPEGKGGHGYNVGDKYLHVDYPKTSFITTDWIPEGWTDIPMGVGKRNDEEDIYNFEWVATRRLLDDGTWSYFSYPAKYACNSDDENYQVEYSPWTGTTKPVLESPNNYITETGDFDEYNWRITHQATGPWSDSSDGANWQATSRAVIKNGIKTAVTWSDWEVLWVGGKEGGTVFTSMVFTVLPEGKDISAIQPQGGTFDSPIPTGNTGTEETITWHDTVPTTAGIVWMTVAQFNSKLATGPVTMWSKPKRMIDTADMEVMYSPLEDVEELPSGFTKINGVIKPEWLTEAKRLGWYDKQTDIPAGSEIYWMATNTTGKNGKWTDDWSYMKVKGEKGEKGETGEKGEQGNPGVDGSYRGSVYALVGNVVPDANPVIIEGDNDPSQPSFQSDSYCPRFKYYVNGVEYSGRTQITAVGADADHVREYEATRSHQGSQWYSFSDFFMTSMYVTAALTPEQMEEIKSGVTKEIGKDLDSAVKRIKVLEDDNVIIKEDINDYYAFKNSGTSAVTVINQNISAVSGVAELALTKAESGYTQIADVGQRMSTAEGTIETHATLITTAQSTADKAVSDAANAQSTANTAKSDAANAQSTADGAKTAADNAQNTANEAMSGVTNVDKKVDNEIKDVRQDFNASAATIMTTATQAHYLMCEYYPTVSTAVQYFVDYESHALFVKDDTRFYSKYYNTADNKIKGSLYSEYTTKEGYKNIVIAETEYNNFKSLVADFKTKGYELATYPDYNAYGIMVTDAMSFVKQSAKEIDLGVVDNDSAAQFVMRATNSGSGIYLIADKIALNGAVEASSLTVNRATIVSGSTTYAYIKDCVIDSCTILSDLQSSGYTPYTEEANGKGFTFQVHDDSFAINGTDDDGNYTLISNKKVIIPSATITGQLNAGQINVTGDSNSIVDSLKNDPNGTIITKDSVISNTLVGNEVMGATIKGGEIIGTTVKGGIISGGTLIGAEGYVGNFEISNGKLVGKSSDDEKIILDPDNLNIKYTNLSGNTMLEIDSAKGLEIYDNESYIAGKLSRKYYTDKDTFIGAGASEGSQTKVPQKKYYNNNISISTKDLESGTIFPSKENAQQEWGIGTFTLNNNCTIWDVNINCDANISIKCNYNGYGEEANIYDPTIPSIYYNGTLTAKTNVEYYIKNKNTNKKYPLFTIEKSGYDSIIYDTTDFSLTINETLNTNKTAKVLLLPGEYVVSATVISSYDSTQIGGYPENTSTSDYDTLVLSTSAWSNTFKITYAPISERSEIFANGLGTAYNDDNYLMVYRGSASTRTTGNEYLTFDFKNNYCGLKLDNNGIQIKNRNSSSYQPVQPIYYSASITSGGTVLSSYARDGQNIVVSACGDTSTTKYYRLLDNSGKDLTNCQVQVTSRMTGSSDSGNTIPTYYISANTVTVKLTGVDITKNTYLRPFSITILDTGI